MKPEIVNGVYDEAARQSFKVNPNSCVSWWIAASYQYYHCNESLLSDTCYDNLAKYIKKNFDKLSHQHLHLITKDNLEAGSLYNLKASDYPEIVKNSSEMLVRELLVWRNKNGQNQI